MDVAIKDSGFIEYYNNNNNNIMLDLMLNYLQNFRMLINFQDDTKTVYHGHDFFWYLGTMSHMVVNSVESASTEFRILESS